MASAAAVLAPIAPSLDGPSTTGQADELAASAPAMRVQRRTLTVRVRDGESAPTEFLTITAERTPAQLQIWVIPGNPGNPRMYTLFLERLHEHFGGCADVSAVSHAGHEADSPGDKAWSLDCQIAHKVALLQDHILLPGQPPVIVVCHSIGAFITLQALAQLESGAAGHLPPGAPCIEKVVICKPFLSVNPSCPRQMLIRTAAARGEMVAALAGGLARTSEGFKRWLLRWLAPATVEPHAVEAVTGLISRGSVLNNFVLARHEFVDLAKPADWSLLQRLGPRAAVIAAPRDMWFPRHHYEEMLETVTGLQAFWEEDLSHAFCVSARQSDKVARMVAEIASDAAMVNGAASSLPVRASRL